MIRVDFKCLTSALDSKHLSMFMRRLVSHLKRQYNCIVGYAWAREQLSGKYPHYHTALLLNGHKVNHPSNIIKLIEKMIQNQQVLNFYVPRHCYYQISRSCTKSQQAAIYRLSYLAKNATKGYRPKQTKDYQTSRNKPKPATTNSN
ncbi:YagK/YfjJ domain-containing protein [Photobacterium ganghwense]